MQHAVSQLGKAADFSQFHRSLQTAHRLCATLDKRVRQATDKWGHALLPELFGAILLFLDVHAVLALAPVCKTWRDMGAQDAVWKVFYMRGTGWTDESAVALPVRACVRACTARMRARRRQRDVCACRALATRGKTKSARAGRFRPTGSRSAQQRARARTVE
jgi:hypothetical protein